MGLWTVGTLNDSSVRSLPPLKIWRSSPTWIDNPSLCSFSDLCLHSLWKRSGWSDKSYCLPLVRRKEEERWGRSLVWNAGIQETCLLAFWCADAYKYFSIKLMEIGWNIIKALRSQECFLNLSRGESQEWASTFLSTKGSWLTRKKVGWNQSKCIHQIKRVFKIEEGIAKEAMRSGKRDHGSRSQPALLADLTSASSICLEAPVTLAVTEVALSRDIYTNRQLFCVPQST